MTYPHTYTARNGVTIQSTIPMDQDRADKYGRLSKRGIAQSGGFATPQGQIGHWQVVR